MNLQPPVGKDLRTNGMVNIHSIWETLQGEGPNAGTPAVFIRLFGCNLQCSGCDTEYTSVKTERTPEDTIVVVRELRRSGLVVLTGGEPMRQNIAPLCHALLNAGYSVQIETNGTFYLPDLPYLHGDFSIICSPKTAHLNPQLIPHIFAYKYVVEAGYTDEFNGLPTRVLGDDCFVAQPPDDNTKPVFIQACDVQDDKQNELNMRQAIQTCMEHEGYRLSVQMHKIVGLL